MSDVTPDDLSEMNGLVVVNPEAIGDPEASPRVFVGADVMALLKPCGGYAPSRDDNYCGGVNGFHAPDCSGTS